MAAPAHARLLTLFSKSLRLDLACRVWDSYFVQGDVFIWRVAVGTSHAVPPVPCRSYQHAVHLYAVWRDGCQVC